MKLTFINLLQYKNQKYTSSASTENSMAPKAPKSILNTDESPNDFGKNH